MQKIKCKNGKCWDENSSKKKLRSICDPEDIACQVDADLIEDQIDDDIEDETDED